MSIKTKEWLPPRQIMLRYIERLPFLEPLTDISRADFFSVRIQLETFRAIITETEIQRILNPITREQLLREQLLDG